MKPRPQECRIYFDGETLRIDGVERGAVLLNLNSESVRVRITREEGGVYRVDQIVRGEGAKRLARIYQAARPLGGRTLAA